jgi:hypothetical protein
MELIGIVEGLSHSASPPANAREHFLATPPPTLDSSSNSPTSTTKKYRARYSLSSEVVELNPLSSAPRVVMTDGREQPHRQHTPCHTHNHQPHNSNHIMPRGTTSISQSITASTSTTVTTSSSGISDTSQRRYPIASGDSERKKVPSDSDSLHPSSTTFSFPSNAPPVSGQMQSTTRQLPPPNEGELPPAYEDVR